MMQGVILDFDSVGPADLDLSKLYELPVQGQSIQIVCHRRLQRGLRLRK